MTLGIVCGYRAEYRIATRITKLVAMGWRNPDAAQHLIAAGATTLVSFGVAGGLDPELEAGTLLLPRHVLAEGEALPVSPDLHGFLFERFSLAVTQPIYASPTLLVTSLEKRRLFSLTNAVAIDMESGAVAKAAIEAGMPFAVVRVVSDPADHSLPQAAQAALTDAGDVDYPAVIFALLKDPFQLADLIRTGQQNNAALRRLEDMIGDLRELLL